MDIGSTLNTPKVIATNMSIAHNVVMSEDGTASGGGVMTSANGAFELVAGRVDLSEFYLPRAAPTIEAVGASSAAVALTVRTQEAGEACIIFRQGVLLGQSTAPAAEAASGLLATEVLAAALRRLRDIQTES